MAFNKTNIINVRDDDNEHSVTMSATLPFDDVSNFVMSLDTLKWGAHNINLKHDNDFDAFRAFKRNVNAKVYELRRALAIAEGFASMINAMDETELDDQNKWTE